MVDRPIKSRPASFAHYTPQTKLIVFVKLVDPRRKIPSRSAGPLLYPDTPLEYPQVDGWKGALMRSSERKARNQTSYHSIFDQRSVKTHLENILLSPEYAEMRWLSHRCPQLLAECTTTVMESCFKDIGWARGKASERWPTFNLPVMQVFISLPPYHTYQVVLPGINSGLSSHPLLFCG